LNQYGTIRYYVRPNVSSLYIDFAQQNIVLLNLGRNDLGTKNRDERYEQQ